MRRKKRHYLFYADQLMDDGAPHAQARHIISTDNSYVELVKRHARQMVADGRGDWWFVRVERDNESTLWVLENSTVTMHDLYIKADSTLLIRPEGPSKGRIDGVEL